MRVWLTGGTGFIGTAVVRALRARGDEVVVVVRDPPRAAGLAEAGAEILANDLSSTELMAAAMRGVDAVVHLAGSYRIGITVAERPQMWEANVGTTERVLDAAIAAQVPRIIYVSTANTFGDTKGRIVDETYRRNLADGFVSFYDEAKYRAHEAAEARIARGAPIIIAQPGTTYGPHDHSEVGNQLDLAFHGKMPYRALDDVGITPVHVDDEAAGIIAALDQGRIGESYVLAGPPMRLHEATALAARLGGRRLPRLRIPGRVLRLIAPLAARLGPRTAAALGLPPNLAEVVSAGDGVTYWASSAKAERELGFHVRDLESGLRNTFGPR